MRVLQLKLAFSYKYSNSFFKLKKKNIFSLSGVLSLKLQGCYCSCQCIQQTVPKENKLCCGGVGAYETLLFRRSEAWCGASHCRRVTLLFRMSGYISHLYSVKLCLIQ